MNEKASVSKELDAKHAKLLEGLLELPENRECADCHSKAPRWASINLGVFICMQCCGIHRSLSAHISKVRSTTLDTWLPEQVAFMQYTGNERSNSYWEAELPHDFDRSDIENFIHTKYKERKWASKTEAQPTPPLVGKRQNGDKPRVAKSGIPKKARKYSLGDEVFAEEEQRIVPMTRSRAGSLDMTDMFILSPAPNGVIAEPEVSDENVDTTQDLFSLLYVSDSKQNRTVVPPSRWATFD